MSIIETSGDGYIPNLCEDVAAWFVNQFIEDEICLEIEHVALDHHLTFGYCTVMDDYHKPRHFLIELKPFMSEKKYIQTLFHELTHMRQWIDGRLTWDGRKSYFCQECTEDYEYMDQPHEIEARNEEERLYNLYLSDKESVPVA